MFKSAKIFIDIYTTFNYSNVILKWRFSQVNINVFCLLYFYNTAIRITHCTFRFKTENG